MAVVFCTGGQILCAPQANTAAQKLQCARSRFKLTNFCRAYKILSVMVPPCGGAAHTAPHERFCTLIVPAQAQIVHTIKFDICRYGGIGRRAGLRIPWATVQVQLLLSAPNSGGKDFLAVGIFFVQVNAGVEGRQASSACAGRRVLPPTKQRTPAVFRARPLKAQLLLSAPGLMT